MHTLRQPGVWIPTLKHNVHVSEWDCVGYRKGIDRKRSSEHGEAIRAQLTEDPVLHQQLTNISFDLLQPVRALKFEY